MIAGHDVKKLNLNSALYKKYLELSKFEYIESTGDGKIDKEKPIDPEDIEMEVIG